MEYSSMLKVKVNFSLFVLESKSKNRVAEFTVTNFR
ncbi:hypothetical protein SAMN05192529_104163 [Arachidicoccus rhizosphaerae]|uniref:Uncharacterized protein n=1 Tax=Arachidicoccus rhizosphaerae TaxID=551991 RepID=A0A1H3X2D3_9BACT|nr:hypothetical protein SAMN05192529_104163 [Arachidicoccus rhizosphaerae]